MNYSLSKEELRSYLIRYHSLDNYDRLSSAYDRPSSVTGKRADDTSRRNQGTSSQIKKLLGRVGSLQYDPLNVAGRNSDLFFQSRVKDYTVGFLDILLYKERSLFDGWDKEMSICLTKDWPYFHRIRERRKESALRTLNHRGQSGVLSYLPQVMEEIKNRGPLAARDIKLGATKKNRWGHRQVSGAAMDYLLAAGELGIYDKKSAQKIYAPIGDLVPEKIFTAPDPFTCDDDFIEWYVSRRIGSLGAYWFRNGPGWQGFYLSDSALRQKALQSLEEKKIIVRLTIPEIDETFYMRRKDLPVLNDTSRYDGSARILAPLDNMLWDRLFVKKVFDFEYTWEVYVPASKRKYGYYVLPVLYRDNLVARFEPSRFEQGRPFAVTKWWWEPSYHASSAKTKKEMHEAVMRALENFAQYLGAGGVDKRSIISTID